MVLRGQAAFLFPEARTASNWRADGRPSRQRRFRHTHAISRARSSAPASDSSSRPGACEPLVEIGRPQVVWW